MKFFLSLNDKTEEQCSNGRKLVDILKCRFSAEIAMSAESSMALYQTQEYACFQPHEADLIISLGGDGAVLRAAHIAAEADKPLLGINSGRLGYLCTISFSEAEELTLEKLQKMYCSERALMTEMGLGKTAVNDILVIKRNGGEAIDLEVQYSRHEKMRFRGDGVIICTPTGSSAYNLSAGGPFAAPDAPVFCITPICAHFSDARPVVVSDQAEISVKVIKAEGGADIYIDGKLLAAADNGICIKKADRKLRILEK